MISEIEIENRDDPDRPQTGIFEKLCGNFDKNISRFIYLTLFDSTLFFVYALGCITSVNKTI